MLALSAVQCQFALVTHGRGSVDGLPAPAVSYLCHQAGGPYVGSLAKYNNPLIPRAIRAGSSRSPRGRANRRDLHVPSCLVTTARHPCA